MAKLYARTFFSCFYRSFILFLWLAISSGDRVFAQNHDPGDELQQATVSGPYIDGYGYYVQFYLPVSNTDGIDRWIKSGKISIQNGHTYGVFAYYSSASKDNKDVNFSVNGYRGARIRAYNGDAANNTWSGFITTASGNQVRRDGGANLAEIYARWYIPASLIGSTRRFRIDSEIDGNNGAGRGPTGDKQYLLGPVTFSNPVPEANLGWSFSGNAGKLSFDYSYDDVIATSEYSITHWLTNYPDKVADDTNNRPSGSIEVDMSNQPFDYTFYTEIEGKDGWLTYDRMQDFKMPAYVWPDQLNATYDDNNTVTLTWKVPAMSGTGGTDYIDGDNFELERSTDPDFLTNTKTVVTYPYDPDRTVYEIEDDLRDLEGGSRVYYRLRRTKSASQWKWDEVRKTDLEIDMNTTFEPGTVILDESDGSPKAIITWEKFRGVWTSGTEFLLKKSNLTSGSAPEIIKLTEEQARSGEYTDENIRYCNEFSYAVAITLGNDFDSPAETEIPGTILAVEIGTIRNLTISKGYFPDRTELEWTAQGVFDNYIIKRRVYGSGDDFAQIATVQGTSSGDVQTDDIKGIPGVYYQYMVVGAVRCNNTNRYSKDTLYAVGFRSPTGTIYGRITYENGQAVENVAVRLESADNSQLGQSVYLNGASESYLKIDSLHHPFSGSAFTVEAWVRPDEEQPVNQVIFSQDGQYELGFDGAGQLYFRYKNEIVTGAYTNQNQSFVHLAGIYGRDSLGLMLNDSLIAIIPCPPQPGGTPDTTVYIGRNAAGNNFKGYIDEMRVWNIALLSAQIKRDYTRLMAGNEAGLAAYWRFDETIQDQFYDLSNTSSDYHKNDGMLASQAVHSNVIPTPDQLSLKAYTDATGNYMISGIPFTGNGTTYAIVPLLGTHQFDPTSVNRLISSNSLEFTVNFVDKSSFPVSGYVYYHNTTVPVKGVQFQIDGKYAQKENGQLIETDASGRFTISVPVGRHEVRAVKTNHVFVNGGKITNRFGEDLNYQGPISERILHDSTSVRFIGRVAGGVIQDNFPLGHSLSANNLGENLEITMQLTGPQNRKINAGASDSTIIVKHLLPSNQSDSSKLHQTRVDFEDYTITIHPDSLTGEFAVDLIPEHFTVTAVKATGHDNLNLPEGLPTIDLTNAFFPETEVYAYKDSTAAGDGSWNYTNYSDTVRYNYAYKFIERNKPELSVVQLDASGSGVPYFGDTTTAVVTFGDQGMDVPVYDASDNSYLFGYPVFGQNTSYKLKISAYERYEYFEQGNSQPASVDRVPSLDGLISIQNDLRYGASGTDTLSLDENGEGIYQFKVGEPEITDPAGRKSLSVSVQIGDLLPILWTGNPLEGYITGWKKMGTDFITAGPNEIVRVLRDPPGSSSYSWFEEGTSTVTDKEYVGSVVQAGSEELKNSLKAATITFAGVGAGTITVAEAGNTYAGKFSHSESFTGTDKSTTVTKFLTRYQTSSDPTYVGADADLFIGNSTNYTYGSTLEMMVVKNSEVKSTDLVFFDGSEHDVDYSIIRRIGINIAQDFGTHFVYTAKHIQDILIPSIIEIRNNLFLPVATDPATAQQMANSSEEEVYVSKLTESDPNYGKSNVDTEAFGPDAATAPWGDGESYKIYVPDIPGYNQTDTILSLNQHIEGWEWVLSENERMKVTDGTLVKNFSFTGGGDVQYSEVAGIAQTYTRNFNITLGAAFLASVGVTLNKTGMTLNVEEGITTSHGGNFSEVTDTTKTFGFELSESSVDYLSVDVSRASDSTFIFKTKGGETACPYEGATYTNYYQPGTILDQPTMRAEAPGISVVEPVVTDIPSTRNATYSIKLQNESQTDRGVSFFLQVLEKSNPEGAKVYMDGAPLATGRAVWINPGQVLEKTITLERGPEAMDYEDIMLRLISECDTTSFDIVNISAHFIPSCSDVHIESPSDQWLLNTQSQVNDNDERFLPIELNEFDVSNDLFGYIELEYRSLSSPTWTPVMKFYADSAAYEAANEPKAMISGSSINYNMVMTDAAFSDQQYEIRAVAVCMDEGQVISTTPSNTVRGTKDTYRPRLFGSPQPANGVLGITDEVRLNFNETIAAGLLSYPNFQVTGIRNGTLGDHSVSVRLDGQGDHLATEFNKNLEGKDITVEMWILPQEPGNGPSTGSPAGTLFSHGDINQSMELALAAGNYLEVTVGETVVKSEAPVPYKPNEWAHVALVYDAVAAEVSAFYNFVEVIQGAPVTTPYSGSGHFEFGRSIGRQGNTFAGAMHEARIWADVLTGTRLQVNSLTRLSGGENGLLAYYPMTEGKGDKAFDKAHGAHALLTGDWTTPPGKAVAFDGNGYLKVSAAVAPVTERMDYTLELWFKAEPGQSDAALASSGKGDGSDNGGSRSLFFLGFEDGLLTYRNNGIKVQAQGNYLDNDWHHVAVAVNRNSGTAQLFVDGVLNQYFDANALGGLEAPFIYLGARGWHAQGDAATVSFDRRFQGKIDEFRLWNTYLNETLVSNNSNVRLKGDELGLLLYYPFETYVEFQNNKELAFSLSDLKIQQDPATVVPDAEPTNALETDDKAPIKDRGPTDNLKFDFVVNDDGLIINLLEPRQAIDKTIVTFRVDEVRDLQGNMIESPVTWTAYIDRNQLSWSDDEFTLSKELYAPMEFESYVLNSGGSVQQFRLDNLPSWLQATPSSGTVEPQGRQKIVFRVNEGLNVGTYDEIIYMRNDDDETETLPLTLKVTGEEPEWNVDPSEFDYSMVVYGKLRINGIFSSNPDDILAAFSGGECVGFTRNVYNESNDLWYAFLTVYSNTLQHDELEFRIWDAGTGTTYQAVPSASISFSSDAIAGTAASPILFDGQEMRFQNIALSQGWNWISFQLAGTSLEDISATLSKGEWQPGDIVKNEELGFHQYSSSDGWVGYLESFNNTSLFMLRTGLAQSLSIGGIPLDIAGTSIPVKGGRWNYISYLPQTNMTVQEALAGYEASDEDVIKSQTGFAMYNSQTGWVGNLTYLEPGKGYMLYRKAADDVTFHYPAQDGILSQASRNRLVESVPFRSSGGGGLPADASPAGLLAGGQQRGDGGSAQLLNPLQAPVGSNFSFAENMTVIAVLEDEFDLHSGDRVLAYVNGELRGKAQQVATPLNGKQQFFINIAGDEEAPVYFEIERQGRVVARSATTITYRSNSRTGTVDDPLVIRIENEYAKISMYPNPFGRLLTISGEIRQDAGSGAGSGSQYGTSAVHEVQLLVYDVTGARVLEGAPQRISGTNFRLTWDGRTRNGQVCQPGVYFIHVLIDGRPLSGKVIKVDSPK